MPSLPLHILFVESHDARGVPLAKILFQQGHEVQLANSCEEAIEIARFQRLDLVIVNLVRPDFDGVMLLDRLREHQRDIKAIALCDFSGADRAKPTSFNLHLSREELSSLEAAIDKLFHRRSRRDFSPRVETDFDGGGR